MANRGFNSVLILSTLCICTQLGVVLLQNPGFSNYANYYTEDGDHDIAVRMLYSQVEGDTALNVTVAYETRSVSSTKFFQEQISFDMLDKLNSCGTVNMVFIPCATSLIDHQTGQLYCVNGPDQCYYDQVHSCIADSLRFDETVLGKFLICNFSGKGVPECAKLLTVDDGVSLVDGVNTCVKVGNGAQSCDNFHNILEIAKFEIQPANIGQFPDAITDFKNTLCLVLASAGLSCDTVCALT